MTATWRDQAACRGVDTDVFFPVAQTDERAWAPARAICRTCRVKAACLDYALATEGTSGRAGMWGATTPDERARIARRRRRAKR